MTLKFSSDLCGLKKKHISQYYFFKMIETRKQQFDKKDYFGVLLMDLSKTFDTINLSLL